jgi:hypothetical protein
VPDEYDHLRESADHAARERVLADYGVEEEDIREMCLYGHDRCSFRYNGPCVGEESSWAEYHEQTAAYHRETFFAANYAAEADPRREDYA